MLGFSPFYSDGFCVLSFTFILVPVWLWQTTQGFLVVWSGVNFLSSPQSTKDIESRIRSETRLKLFTLDPDTQVKHWGTDQVERDHQRFCSFPFSREMWPFLLSAHDRNWTSQESSRMWNSLRRSLANACWSTATTWPSTCRAAWPRTTKDPRQT